MKLKFCVDEDFLNYKKPCMFLGTPCCTFKCDKECGEKVCQNSNIIKQTTIDVGVDYLTNRYMSNKITKAIVIGGLEPFDTFDDVINFIDYFRKISMDDIVIYSGYNEDEIYKYTDLLKDYKNIIVKFGRFIPNQEPHFDDVLGVNLASNNQYAKEL